MTSHEWDCHADVGCAGSVADVGAVTWGSGSTGVNGPVTSTNSLVGSTASDFVGYGGVTALSNGNYVVISDEWNCQASLGCVGTIAKVGAVTWGSGITGVSGAISHSNSLVGSTANDHVGRQGVIALTNGHYVVGSMLWDCQPTLGCSGTIANVGAATWGSGTTGISGPVRSANSLIGSTAEDNVGRRLFRLTNGNYVVASPRWDCLAALGCSGTIANAGAVTWGEGSTGTTGQVTFANSLVGSTANDLVGDGVAGVVSLTNGNYVVISPYWDCRATLGCSGTIANVGAVTWSSGTSGIKGVVTAGNSLVGSTAGDTVGNSGVTALTNGNYVVRSSVWDCTIALGCAGAISDVGAVTWSSGTTGITGAVATTNSLTGSSASDVVGDGPAAALSNGNYVILSTSWNCRTEQGCASTVAGVGAVTWGSGVLATSGTVSTANSLVGSTMNDHMSTSLWALPNGNFVISRPFWTCKAGLGCAATASNAGAVSWGSGTSGISGVVSSTNSLTGTAVGDAVGVNGITVLTNGNYIINSGNWNCKTTSGCTADVARAGAQTWASGTAGIAGQISPSNSLVGSSTFDSLGASRATALTNGNYVLMNMWWNCQVSAGCPTRFLSGVLLPGTLELQESLAPFQLPIV